MSKMENIVNVNKDSSLMKITKGLIISIGITMVLLFIFSLLLAYTNISENTIVPVIMVITAVSILIGSSISLRNVRKNGMLCGGSVGIIYILILYLLSSMCGSGFEISLNSIIVIVTSIFAGSVGGIIGINQK